jgi:putative PIN family toxin of toxin-antitoxin system
VRVILDTNVFVAGVFFAGPPYAILDAWRHGRISLVVSPEIMEEYRRVAHELATEFPGVDPGPPLELIAIHAQVVDAPPLPAPVCTDSTDDMFLACAVASGTKIITSGDKALLRTSGYKDVEVLTPRAFLDKYLK